MDYKDKYIKYKTKYKKLCFQFKNIDINNMIGGKNIKKHIILLFPDILSNIKLPSKIINKLKRKYKIIELNYDFNDSELKNKFKLEDLQFENIAKNIYDNLDKNNNYITIGFNQGCHICNYFSNKYKKIVKMQILLNNRRINAENYEKTIIRGNRMLEMNYNKEFADKYKLGIISDDDLIDKLNEKDKYKDLIHHTIALKIREQYKKVPIKQYIKTYIFDQIVSDLDIIYEHNLKDDKTKNIKDIQSIEKAIIDHCKSNVDKIKQNNNMINNSEFGLVIVDYEIDIPEGTTIFTKNRIQKLLYLLNR